MHFCLLLNLCGSEVHSCKWWLGNNCLFTYIAHKKRLGTQNRMRIHLPSGFFSPFSIQILAVEILGMNLYERKLQQTSNISSSLCLIKILWNILSGYWIAYPSAMVKTCFSCANLNQSKFHVDFLLSIEFEHTVKGKKMKNFCSIWFAKKKNLHRTSNNWHNKFTTIYLHFYCLYLQDFARLVLLRALISSFDWISLSSFCNPL